MPLPAHAHLEFPYRTRIHIPYGSNLMPMETLEGNSCLNATILIQEDTLFKFEPQRLGLI